MPPWMMGCSMPNISVMAVFIGILSGADNREKGSCARRQAAYRRQEFEPGAGPPMFGQCLIIGIGIPGADLCFGREFEDDHPALARQQTFQRESVIATGHQFAAIALE